MRIENVEDSKPSENLLTEQAASISVIGRGSTDNDDSSTFLAAPSQ